ncbi:MAG: CBS domain-containing protein [Actinomycetota bacterium]
MSRNVGALASRRIVSVGENQTLADAARRMNEQRVGSAIVLIEGSMPGIITERDLLRSIADGADPSTALVGDYMTPIAITASANWDLQEAAQRMFDGGFRHLIVLDEQGSPAGILSMRDVAKALLEIATEDRPTSIT